MKIRISDINIGERARRTYDDIPQLAASLAKYGLIEPIVIDAGKNLVAGGRRLKAAISINWTEIEVRELGELSEIERKEIELEENVMRKQMGWQEEVNAKAQIHELRKKLHGEASKGKKIEGSWKVIDTANALDESAGSTSMDLQLAEGLKYFPELAKEKAKTTAYKKYKQLLIRVQSEALAGKLKDTITCPNIIHGNCIEEMGKMKAESIDLILTDPPWGIDIDNSQVWGRQGSNSVAFEDGESTTFDMLDKAIEQIWRILKYDRHIYMFYACEFYSAVRNLLEKHGFQVHPYPLIWDKGSGSYPSQQTSYVHSYEPLLWASKGKRLLNGTPRDIFPIKRVPSDQKTHPTEKPTELLRDLIKMSTNAGELVLDPFAGSGATIVAAKECLRQGIGIELDKVYYTSICERVKATI